MANSNPRRLASATMRARRIILSPAPARTRVPSIVWSRLTTRMTRPSTPASAIRRLVPAPSRRYGISRSTAPAMMRSIASARPDSTKNSAGPPMPNDVRVASASSSLTPGSARSQSRLDFLRQLIAQLLANVARPHQQEQVVRSDQILERLARIVEAAYVRAVGQPMREVARADAGRVLLTRRINVEEQHAVSAIERAREVVHEGGQPRVAVRLEDHEQAAVPELSRRLDGCAHLGGMVAIVVVYGGALEQPEQLQPAVRPREMLERNGDLLEVDANLEGHGRGAGRVLDVVPAALAQVDAAERQPAVMDGERPRPVAAVVGALVEAVCDLARLSRQRARAGVISTNHGEAVGRELADELGEQRLHRLDVGEMVGVVELDVGDERALRVVQEERAVGLVDLGDEPPRTARARVAAVADQHGRVEARLGQDVAGHVRDRGLAVAAADGD